MIIREADLMRPANLISLILASLLPILALGSLKEDQEQLYYYYYYKEKVFMVAESRSIAVYDYDYSQDSINGSMRSLFRAAGHADPDFREFPVPGWSIAILKSASGTPDISSVSPVISRLIQLDKLGSYYFSPIFGNESGEVALITPNILIRLEKGVSESGIRHILESVGESDVELIPFGGMDNSFRITTKHRDGLRTLATANLLAESSDIICAEPEIIMTGKTSFLPNDQLFSDSWGLHNTGQAQFPGAVVDMDIDAPEGWDKTTGDPSIIVVVIDTGVQQDHPDINQIPGTDTTPQPSPSKDGGPGNACDHHGTWVAGVVSGIINNFIGTAGVAPGVKVSSARAVISAVGSCSGKTVLDSAWLVEALEWAETIGARITNNSYTVAFPSGCLIEKFKETRDNGILHFAGAGNDPEEAVAFPANHPSVVGVSGIDWTGQLSSFSSFGPEIEFTAPASQIRTTDRTGSDGKDPGDYIIMDGTSFASPMAAGVAALVLSDDPDLSPAEVVTNMCDTAVDLGAPGRDDLYGCGLANAGRAVGYHRVFADGFESGDTSKWQTTVE